jgi:hypothetical protein
MQLHPEVVNNGGNGDAPDASLITDRLREDAFAATAALLDAFSPLLKGVHRDALGVEGEPWADGLQTLVDMLEQSLATISMYVRGPAGDADVFSDFGQVEAASARVEGLWELLLEMKRLGLDFGEDAGGVRALDDTAAKLAVLAEAAPPEEPEVTPGWWRAVEAPVLVYFEARRGALPWPAAADVVAAAAEQAHTLAAMCRASSPSRRELRRAIATLRNAARNVGRNRVPDHLLELRAAVGLARARWQDSLADAERALKETAFPSPEAVVDRLNSAATEFSRAAELLREGGPAWPVRE